MMYSIVNEEPTPIQNHLPEISSEFVHILNRALEKDPNDRYQNVADMVIDLRRLKKQTSKVSRSVPAMQPSEVSMRETGKPSAGAPRSRKRMAILLVTTALVVCAVVLVLWLSKGLQLNPDMKFRIVQLPFRDVSYASMSQEGSWIVFPAADDRGKFDVYMMNVSQGQPRRITNDSCYSIYNVSLSPDASTILYSRMRSSPVDPLEVVSISSLGGTGRVIVDTGYNIGWRPDGQRIGYLRQPAISGNRMILRWWSCRPDGSDRRIEIADTTSRRPGTVAQTANSRMMGNLQMTLSGVQPATSSIRQTGAATSICGWFLQAAESLFR
jgi:serine/threonine protein kinase